MTRLWFMARHSPRINQDMPKVNSDTDWKPRQPRHRQLSSDVICRLHHNSHWEKICASPRLKYSELLIWIIKGKCDIFSVAVILVASIHLATHLSSGWQGPMSRVTHSNRPLLVRLSPSELWLVASCHYVRSDKIQEPSVNVHTFGFRISRCLQIINTWL